MEAAAIDLIGFENLTNRVIGHGAKQFGRMSVDAVHAKLSARKLEQFEHHCIAITVANSLARARERLALASTTRRTMRSLPSTTQHAEPGEST